MFKPVGDYIKIRPEIYGELFKGTDFVVPPHMQGKPRPYGEVVAVGSGTPISNQEFKIGDKVFFSTKSDLMFVEDDVVYFYANQFFVIAKEIDGEFCPTGFTVKVNPDPRIDVLDPRNNNFYPWGKVMAVSENAEFSGIKKGWSVDYSNSRMLRIRDFNTGEMVDYVNCYELEKAFDTGKGMTKQLS